MEGRVNSLIYPYQYEGVKIHNTGRKKHDTEHIRASRTHNKVPSNSETAISVYHLQSLSALGDQEQLSWEVQAQEVTMWSLKMSLRLEASFPGGPTHEQPCWSSGFIPLSTTGPVEGPEYPGPALSE